MRNIGENEITNMGGDFNYINCECITKIQDVNLIDYRLAEPRNASSTVTIIDNGIKWSGDYFVKIPVDNLTIGKTYVCNFSGELAINWALAYTDATYRIVANGFPITATKEVNYVYLYKLNPTTFENDIIFTNIRLEEV